jgi:hypothetical protein
VLVEDGVISPAFVREALEKKNAKSDKYRGAGDADEYWLLIAGGGFGGALDRSRSRTRSRSMSRASTARWFRASASTER